MAEAPRAVRLSLPPLAALGALAASAWLEPRLALPCIAVAPALLAWGMAQARRFDAAPPLRVLWWSSALQAGALFVTAALLFAPLQALLGRGALGAALLFSGLVAAVAAVAWRHWALWPLPLLRPSLTRSWPAWRQNAPAELQRIARAPAAGWAAVSAGLLLTTLLVGGAVLGMFGVQLPPGLRMTVTLAYAVLLGGTQWALLRLAQRALQPARMLAGDARERPVATAPVQLPGQLPAQALYAAARLGRVDTALELLAAGADARALPEPEERDQRWLLMLAAVLPDLRLLRELIARGVDVNHAHGGGTALLAATRDSYHGRPEAVMMLLANGADPRVHDGDGNTALHFAALSADPTVAAALLDAGAPLDIVNRAGWTPLGSAAGAGNWPLARFLLERGARCEPEHGQPALLAATAGEHAATGVQLLLRHKAQVDARGAMNRTALMEACLAGNAVVAAALLEAGADVDAHDQHGVTPLLEAARGGSAAVLQLLVSRRPRPDACDAAGRNALVLLCQSPHADIAALDCLLQLGVDPAQRAADGRRALDVALAAGRWTLVTRLDPDFALPCSVAVSSFTEGGSPQQRLRNALLAARWDEARLWLGTLGAEAENAAAECLLELSALADAPALRFLIAAGADADRQLGDGRSLLTALLARGGRAAAAIVALLERGGSPSGRGALAAYLAACLRDNQVARGCESLALRLLESGADPFGTGPDGAGPLPLCLRLGWLRLAEALLERGIDPDLRDRQGLTPLYLACALGREPAVRLLVRYGARTEARGADGQTPLGSALSAGRRDLARWLQWNTWAPPPRPLRDTDLIQAASTGDVDSVERLLDLGLPLEALDAQGCSALLRACGNGQMRVVEMLLARGADPQRSARSGATCLTAAVSMRHLDVVCALLRFGVPVDQRLPGGGTALMVAAALGLPELVEVLLEAGADANAADEAGQTALLAAAQYAAQSGVRDRALGVVARLLSAGSDVTACSAQGDSVLLLLLGARVDAAAAPIEETLLPCLELLLAHGAQLQVQERRGFAPLHLAAMHGLLRVARRLLAAGADPEVRDSLNRTPHELAVWRGFVDLAAELKPLGVPPVSMTRFLREPGR